MRRILEYNCVIWYKKNSKLKIVQLEKFIKIVQMASKCEKNAYTRREKNFYIISMADNTGKILILRSET